MYKVISNSTLCTQDDSGIRILSESSAYEENLLKHPQTKIHLETYDQEDAQYTKHQLEKYYRETGSFNFHFEDIEDFADSDTITKRDILTHCIIGVITGTLLVLIGFITLIKSASIVANSRIIQNYDIGIMAASLLMLAAGAWLWYHVDQYHTQMSSKIK